MSLVVIRRPGLVVPATRKPAFRPAGQMGGDYSARVLSVRPGHRIGYWPLSEGAGSTAYDLSGRQHHGTYTAVSLGHPGIGDGRTAGRFDGSTSFCNIYSPGLAADFDGAEGTLLLWVKFNDATVWTDGLVRRLVTLAVDGNNSVAIHKHNIAGMVEYQYAAGGVVTYHNVNDLTTLDWMCFGATWSKSADLTAFYMDGVLMMAQGGLGTWAGALNPSLSILGGLNTTPFLVHHGWLAHCAGWRIALSRAEMAYAGRL